MRNQWPMAKVIVIYKSNDGHVRTVKFVLEITNLIRMVLNIWFVRFTWNRYCPKTMRYDSPMEKQTAYIIKTMSHLEGSHIFIVESRELWTSQIFDFDSFDKQLCYCTCLREMFEVSFLRGKYNQRQVAPLVPSIVFCILLWDS